VPRVTSGKRDTTRVNYLDGRGERPQKAGSAGFAGPGARPDDGVVAAAPHFVVCRGVT